MTIDHIELNNAMMAALYRNSLVEADLPVLKNELVRENPAKKKVENIPAEIIPAQKNEWKFLGDHRQKILLVVQYEDVAHIPDKQLQFITSVLGAVKLNLGDVAILNLHHAPAIIFKDVQEKFNSKVILLFGITPAAFSLPIHFPEYQVQAFNNVTFLHAPALEMMEEDKILKSKLWVSLRRVFGV
jgi:hypothetical protein